MPEAELLEKYEEALKQNDYTRLAVYAGTGAGLVTKRQSAKEILDEVELQFQEKVKLMDERLKSI
jgi:hypothetical protein